MKLPTLYLVVAHFGNLGIASAGDATANRDAAYDQYAEAICNMQSARAFRIEFDVETNTLETTTEVTEDFRSELEAICDERGIEVPA